MEYSELNALRRAFERQHGLEATEALITQHGGKNADGTVALGNVPKANFDALATAFQGDAGEAKACGGKRTLESIRTAAFAKFNTPVKRKAEP